MHYSFQNILKFSTCFFTVFRTYWNFNMLFYSFQNMLKISTCFFIVFNTLFQYAFNMYYRFQHALKFSTHVIYSVPQIWKLRPQVKSNIIKIIYIRPSAHGYNKISSYWTQIITTYLMIYKPLKSVDLPLFPPRLDSWSTYTRLKEPVHLRNKIK